MKNANIIFRNRLPVFVFITNEGSANNAVNKKMEELLFKDYQTNFENEMSFQSYRKLFDWGSCNVLSNIEGD